MQDYFKWALNVRSCAVISNKSQCYPNSYIAAGSSSYGSKLELGCQDRLEGVAPGLKLQLSDWQLLITATRQNRTMKYYPSLFKFFFHFHIVLSLHLLLQPLLQAEGLSVCSHQTSLWNIIALQCLSNPKFYIYLFLYSWKFPGSTFDDVI